MGLEFRVCQACSERHAVQRNGQMSIHTDAAGERCTGIVTVAPDVLAARAQEARDRDEEQRIFAAEAWVRRAERAEQERLDKKERGRAFIANIADPDGRLAASNAKSTAIYAVIRKKIAVDEEAERARRRKPLYGMHRTPEKLDQRIYAVNGVRVIPGGLPTLGKAYR